MLIRRCTLLSGVGLCHVRKLVDDDQIKSGACGVTEWGPTSRTQKKAAQFMRTLTAVPRHSGGTTMTNSIAWQRLVTFMYSKRRGTT